ncbi:MAG: NAD(P)H-dependent glycerol-3-phosphate dehydrogenase, partial [Nocardioidaceae bacterium]
FSIVLADAGHEEVAMWARREELCASINEKRENSDYVPGVELPDVVTATHNAASAARGAQIVVFALPSQTLRANLSDWADLLPRDAMLVSLMKGVELGSLKRMSEVIQEVTGADADRIGVVSGPNLAQEIARREPAASVVACADEVNAARLRRLVHTPTFRPYSSTDVIGCELGGAYKNVIALAVGMAHGLGFGDNTTASVITRGLAETARLATALGAHAMTLMGLAGLGDLVATCSSPLSRNRTFGEKLGQGLSTDEILASSRQVAEGVKTCSSLLDLANRAGVDAPIVEHVHAVVEGEMSAGEMLMSLISRETRHERD